MRLFYVIFVIRKFVVIDNAHETVTSRLILTLFAKRRIIMTA